MGKRILTAVVGIAIGVIIVFFLNHTLVYPIVVAAIAMGSVHEILTACDAGFKKFPVHYIWCQIFAALIPMMSWFDQISYAWKLFAACVIVFLLFAGFVADNKKLSFSKLSIMVTVTCLVTLSTNCLISLIKLDPVHGVCYVVMSLMAAWVPDGGAYFVGSALGKHKMCPEISPKKTWEGAVGGVIITAVVFIIYCTVYRMVQASRGYDFTINYFLLTVMVMIAAVISIFGDLSASLIKREYGMKDYGSIFPGHGGFADRFDSVYFVLPFILFAFTAFGGKIFVSSIA
ncbi:MAG: CDP-archaeol synthase [Oscillospiraceae bacterium]|nr:CDP-archaeol synthase [Oscillospiraceae bacterium]MBQ8978971.1 CDP-archaeol synthase [Oscillospiraceae bacterium]